MAASIDSMLLTPGPGPQHAHLPLPIQTRPTHPSLQVPDTMMINQLLMAMRGTMDNLGQTFGTLNVQSEQMANLGPTMHDLTLHLHRFRRQIRSQEKKQDVRIGEVKRMVGEKLKYQITDGMRSQIQAQIKNEVAFQVSNEVDLQIKEHVPRSLETHIAESQDQFGRTEVSLLNSEARRANSALRVPRDLDETISPVISSHSPNPDSKLKSPLFPANLRTLLSYDLSKSRALLRDHGLHASESESREENLNRFMAHIGIHFNLVTF